MPDRFAIPTLSPRGRRMVDAVIVGAAAIGLLLGIWELLLHLTADPLADVRAYYDAGARLNAGLPLYQQVATTNDAEFYRYPPLLAILFRPLALLPFETAALVWEAVVILATVLTLVRLRPRRAALLAACMLGLPLAWTLAIGQAQALVTLFLAIGTPWGVALAGYLKLTPWLAAIYWVSRRDRRALGRFAAWMVGIGLFQLALAPGATIDFLTFSSLEQVGEVRNFSPYAISPVLWVAFVGVLAIAAWRLGPGRFGWAAAVTLAVLATPRLLVYQLSTLLAVFGDRGRDHPVVRGADDPTSGERRVDTGV